MVSTTPAQDAARLPRDLAAALRPILPGLAEETIEAIGREVPDYRRPLEGPFGAALRGGVERALRRFVDLIEDPTQSDDSARAVYVALGRGEMTAGRSLDALLAAYRLGARLAWERFVAAGAAAGHEPETLYRLASAIFTYIDAISAESIEGYTAEQFAAAGERQRRKRILLRLLADPASGEEEARAAASNAQWAWPAALAGVVVASPDADRVAARLGAEALAATDGELTLAFVPDPDAPGRRAQLESALRDCAAALGPTVSPLRAAHSIARARAAAQLVDEGVLEPRDLVVADEHLPELMLHGGDGSLGADLATRRLAPLDELKPGPRARLTETLRAWLDDPGQVQRVAARLHVHPQTVRYRLAQLRELLGDDLDDAEARFELALALRARS